MVLTQAGASFGRLFLAFFLVSAFIGIMSCIAASSESPRAAGWRTVLGGKRDDSANYAYQAPNNDYIFVGTTSSAGGDSWEALVIRIDENGREIFSKTYGNYKFDEAIFAETTPTGETAVIGSSYASSSLLLESFYFLINDQGELLKGVRHTIPSLSYLFDMNKDRDDGFISIIFDFYPNNEHHIARFDENGFFQWSERCCYNELDFLKAANPANNGGYIVTGITKTNDQMQYNMLAVKLDAAGKKVWQRTYGGWYNDGAYDICATKQGGYVIAGFRGGLFEAADDAAVIKIDEQGNVEWEKYFGGKDSDGAGAIHQTRDMGFIVAGTTYSYGEGNADFYVAKLRYNGDIEWETTFGTKRADNAVDIMQTSDGGYLVYGSTKGTGARGSDILVVKLDKDGNSGIVTE